ncbi:glycosyltransferase family 25 protein [Brucella sp. IR073]|uniref:glycosyltransferase family 25 protein n=1 Tax=unclassified Brucella TaxID=2632610 RepID=UPI003B9856D4
MQPDPIKAFIIHLPRATDRRAQVETLIHELPVPAEIIDAVDGRTLAQAEIDRVYRRHLHKPHYPFRLSVNEIACFLSHRKAWQAIVDQGLAGGLVLEDDVALNGDFPAAFAAARDFLAPDRLIRLPFRPGKESGAELFRTENARIIQPVPVGLGMVAQLIGRDAARRMLALTEQFDRPVDTTMQMTWVTGITTLSVHPGGVEEVSANLGGSTIKQKRSLAHRLSREILRPIYRMRIRSLSQNRERS